MGRYITKSDLDQRFGANNIIEWSNLENDTDVADTSRIDAAIAEAEDDIDDRFRGTSYVVPFGPAPIKVKGWACVLAMCWLYFARGMRDNENEDNKMIGLKKEVNAEIDTYTSGQRRLNASRSTTSSPSGPTILRQ